MIRRIKFWLLKKLVSDVTRKLVEQRGYVYLGDMRAEYEITHMAMKAWGLRPEDKEEDDE